MMPAADADACRAAPFSLVAGEAGPLRLDNPKNNFEQGDTDVFKIKAPDVGDLSKIRIYHDNKGFGAAWHLDIVIVSGPAALTAADMAVHRCMHACVPAEPRPRSRHEAGCMQEVRRAA